ELDTAAADLPAVIEQLIADREAFLLGQIYAERAEHDGGDESGPANLHFLLDRQLIAPGRAHHRIWSGLIDRLQARGQAHRLWERQRGTFPRADAPPWLDVLVELLRNGGITIPDIYRPEPPPYPLAAEAPYGDPDRLIVLTVWGAKLIALVRRTVFADGRNDGLTGSVAWDYAPGTAQVKPTVIIVAGRGVAIEYLTDDPDSRPWRLEIFRGPGRPAGAPTGITDRPGRAAGHRRDRAAGQRVRLRPGRRGPGLAGVRAADPGQAAAARGAAGVPGVARDDPGRALRRAERQRHAVRGRADRRPAVRDGRVRDRRALPHRRPHQPAGERRVQRRRPGQHLDDRRRDDHRVEQPQHRRARAWRPVGDLRLGVCAPVHRRVLGGRGAGAGLRPAASAAAAGERRAAGDHLVGHVPAEHLGPGTAGDVGRPGRPVDPGLPQPRPRRPAAGPGTARRLRPRGAAGLLARPDVGCQLPAPAGPSPARRVRRDGQPVLRPVRRRHRVHPVHRRRRGRRRAGVRVAD